MLGFELKCAFQPVPVCFVCLRATVTPVAHFALDSSWPPIHDRSLCLFTSLFFFDNIADTTVGILHLKSVQSMYSVVTSSFVVDQALQGIACPQETQFLDLSWDLFPLNRGKHYTRQETFRPKRFKVVNLHFDLVDCDSFFFLIS